MSEVELWVGADGLSTYLCRGNIDVHEIDGKVRMYGQILMRIPESWFQLKPGEKRRVELRQIDRE